MFELTIVVPTYNEQANILPLVQCLNEALKGVSWELVVVDDDSPDDTLATVESLAHQQPNIRIIRRVNRRGLSSACIEGMMSSMSPYIAVMDADLQHDEKLLPQMLQQLRKEQSDVVVGSRYTEGGGTGSLAKHRVSISRLASRLGAVLVRQDLSDPMSGFFMMRRELLQKAVKSLSATGYKLLLDIVVAVPGNTKISELPYRMRSRQHGDSKLDSLVVLEYLSFLLEKSLGKYLPIKFLSFVAVGASGVIVHLLVLSVLFSSLALDFFVAQLGATMTAMSSNYLLNNLFTYRDQRLRGRQFVTGLFSFYLACSVGAVINLMISSFLNDNSVTWWLSGLSGAFVGSVWNYAITATFTWKSKA